MPQTGQACGIRLGLLRQISYPRIHGSEWYAFHACIPSNRECCPTSLNVFRRRLHIGQSPYRTSLPDSAHTQQPSFALYSRPKAKRRDHAPSLHYAAITARISHANPRLHTSPQRFCGLYISKRSMHTPLRLLALLLLFGLPSEFTFRKLLEFVRFGERNHAFVLFSDSGRDQTMGMTAMF